MRHDPQRQAEQARARNAGTLRLSRLTNGYLVTRADTGVGRAAMTREELHQLVDEFFDDVERHEVRPSTTNVGLLMAGAAR